jgi:hypothetical protein
MNSTILISPTSEAAICGVSVVTNSDSPLASIASEIWRAILRFASAFLMR